MSPNLVYARPGDDGCVELVMVTHETVWDAEMPVLRIMPLEPDRAIKLAAALLNLGLEAKPRQVQAS